MANVETQIILKLDDQFSIPAKKAMEDYKKSLVETQQEANSLESSLRDIEKLKKTYEEMRQVQNESRRARKEAIDSLFQRGEDEYLGWEPLSQAAGAVALLTTFKNQLGLITGPLTAFYLAWKAGQILEEWRVGEQPIEEYVEGMKESLDQLANAEPLALPPIPPETVRSLETTKTCLEQIQNMQDVLITVNLLDNATEQAKRIRQEVEQIFSQDITQRITIIEETIRSAAPSFSGSSNSFFDDGLPEFLTSSPDLTGFNKSVGFSPAKPALPSFASGIDRVPRDMLALIHKDEAVLPKTQAEDFRRGGSSGMSINNLNFSFNVANGAKLDREEFRNMAFMMRDELKRLDRRMD